MEATERDVVRTPATIEAPGDGASYTVVARRYRPQTFEDVVGQDHVVQALRNAIRLNRVTHAYLFCGTRGVGKTSIARIFAKCLNCVTGPTETPCNVCDICRAISVGQDVDVIEIDGASNNGVEAVRELRQNAGLRPSRSRFKIYYIDEVHMLSTGAFNALLKTLEEPPEHVKFFFATTEPNKIPITVLSRCQRYDFAGITPDQIAATLAEICQNEGVQADPDALATIARRASGSMRDAQSLLEQMLSYGGKSLSNEAVHRALGIAPDERVLDLLDALADRDAARVLSLVEAASLTGVQPSDLLAGSVDFLRDVMATALGAGVPLLAAAPGQSARLRAIADRMPIDTILAAMQILAEARGRLRGSSYPRLIVEIALIRVARLEDLAEVAELIGRLSAMAGDGPPTVKKKLAADEPAPPPRPVLPRPVAPTPEPARNGHSTASKAPSRPAPPALAPVPAPTPPPPAEPAPRPIAEPSRAPDLDAARVAWAEMIGRIGTGRFLLSQVRPSAVEPSGTLVVAVGSKYNAEANRFEEARPAVESALAEILGRAVAVRFEPSAEEEGRSSPSPSSSKAELARKLESDPWVRGLMDLFETAPVPIHLELGDDPEVS